MNYAKLVFVFALCLLLRVAICLGADVESEPIQADNNTNQTQVQTNVTVSPEIAASSRENYELEGPATVLGVRHRRVETTPSLALIPNFGTAMYLGDVRPYVSGSWTGGLILEVPIHPYCSVELEGSYASFYFNNGLPASYTSFNLWSGGSSLKAYLTRSTVRPYVGAGFLASYYDGVSPDGNPYAFKLTRWVGDAQIMGGADIELSQNFSIGGRASWVAPLVNKINPWEYGAGSLGAGIINASYARFTGYLRASF